MGVRRYFLGLVCIGLFAAGCTAGTDENPDVEDFDLDSEALVVPPVPPPAPGSVCALIQRDLLGVVEDTDLALGNGGNYAMGWYPISKSGLSTTNHMAVFRFDFSSVVPAGKVVTQAVFNVWVGWNVQNAEVRAHQVTAPWSELTTTFNNFGGTSSFSPVVLGTFDGAGNGFKTLDVTGLAADWHSGAAANYGLLLEEDPVNVHHYNTSEASTDPGKRPSLYVCWTDPPPPPVCVDPGGMCGPNNACCTGICGDNGLCPTVGDPVCASAGAACSSTNPCCVGICGDNHICPSGGGGGTGGSGAGDTGAGGAGAGDSGSGGAGSSGSGGSGGGPVGTGCSGDNQCATGNCWDGVCITNAVCVGIDSGDACSPTNPCCLGGHCVSDGEQGICYAALDQVCVAPGDPCSIFGDPCCWDGMACLGGICKAPLTP